MSTLKTRKIIFENFQMFKKENRLRYSRTGACNKTLNQQGTDFVNLRHTCTIYIFKLLLKQIAIHNC